jgi:hypothetical protein
VLRQSLSFLSDESDVTGLEETEWKSGLDLPQSIPQ